MFFVIKKIIKKDSLWQFEKHRIYKVKINCFLILIFPFHSQSKQYQQLIYYIHVQIYLGDFLKPKWNPVMIFSNLIFNLAIYYGGLFKDSF